MIVNVSNSTKKGLSKKQTKELIEKRSNLWFPEAGRRGRENWMKVVKRKAFPIMSYIRDVMYNMINITKTIIYYGEGNGNPLQYSCLENPMDGGAW